MIDELVQKARECSVPVYTIVEVTDDGVQSRVVNPANMVNNIYSVSKNYTATAIGMAEERGMIKMTDTVYDILHEKYPAICGEDWKKVSVEQVLTQTVGVDRFFLDLDCDDITTYGTTDYLAKVLSEPFTYAPGEHFQYSDSNYYLASRLFSAVSGEELSEFLARELFTPMQYQCWAWARCPHGYAIGATGLFLRVNDMAKFGKMYLDGGVYEGRRYVSEDWVHRASLGRVDVGGPERYGYSFWSTVGHNGFRCGGMLSQVIDIDIEKRRVIAWSACDNDGLCENLQRLLRT